MKYKLKFYVGPTSRYAGVKIEHTEHVCDTEAQAKAWIKDQFSKADAGERPWPLRGYSYKRVRHYQ